MSKRRLTNREQLRKQLRRADPGSVLHQEFLAVKAGIEQPREKAIPALIKLLKSLTTQEAKHFVAKVLGSTKDPRVVGPLLRAAVAPENENYNSNFLWPLINYDLTLHLKFLVDFITAIKTPDETMMVAVMIIRKMNGPFRPEIARVCIRKLLAEVITPSEIEWKMQTEAFRLEAADFIMTEYFNQMRQLYWKPRNGSVQISKTP